MRLGLQVSTFQPEGGAEAIGSAFASWAKEAEAAGFSSLWVMDHFFQFGLLGPADDPMLEGYTALAFAAAVTSKLQLGTLVTGVHFRHPGLLVKTVTTLDALSGGRAYLGIGAGWYERESVGLGVPFPPIAERFERLEETLQIAKWMWSGTAEPFAGTHYQLTEPLCRPLPIQKPHPPIMIGGGGEQRTLRLVARYADACNLFAFDLDQVRQKLDILRRHCDAEGRDYDEIEKTTLGLPPVSRDGGAGTIPACEAVERIGQLAELGVDHHIIGRPSSVAAVEVLMTEVVPSVRATVAAG